MVGWTQYVSNVRCEHHGAVWKFPRASYMCSCAMPHRLWQEHHSNVQRLLQEHVSKKCLTCESKVM